MTTTPEPDPAVDAAEATVRAYCGWHVAPSRTDKLVLDGPGSGALVLPSLRVTDISAITENGTLLDPSYYAWSTTGVVRRMPGWRVDRQPRWTCNYRAVEVEFTHGYNEWPLEVSNVVARLAAQTTAVGAGMYKQVGAVQYALNADGQPVNGTLSSTDKAVLDRYRLPALP